MSQSANPPAKVPAEGNGPQKARGVDLAAGVALADLPQDVPVAGFVGDEDVVAVRQGELVRVVGAKCSHYGAPLAKGRVDGERIVCPWHHAAFSLHDGATLKAPGLSPIDRGGYLYQLGCALSDAGEKAEARQVLLQARALGPQVLGSEVAQGVAEALQG